MEKDPGIETAGGHLKRSQAPVIISTTFRFCWQERGMGVCLEAGGANLGSLRKPIWVLVLARWGAGRRIATSDKTTSREPSCEVTKKLKIYLHLYCLRDMCIRERTDYTGKWNSAISVQPIYIKCSSLDLDSNHDGEEDGDHHMHDDGAVPDQPAAPHSLIAALNLGHRPLCHRRHHRHCHRCH